MKDLCKKVTSRTNNLKDTIHIAFGIQDRSGTYYKNTVAVMVEIFAHTKNPVHVHIFHDLTVGNEVKSTFRIVASEYQQKVSFHNVSSEPEFPKMNNGMLYRLFIPRICSDLKKIIYLDSDVLVLSDVDILWKQDLKEHSIAAVLDLPYTRDVFVSTKYYTRQGINPGKYFNSGMLVMNLTKIRHSADLPREYVSFIRRHPHTMMLDQDFLNLKFQRDTLFLPNKFNFIVDNIDSVDSSILSKQTIIHLAGPFKPWNCRNPFVIKYFCQYFAKNFEKGEREEKMLAYMSELPQRHFERLGLKHSLLQQHKSVGGGQQFLLSLACLVKGICSDAQYIKFARLFMFKLRLAFLYSFYYIYIKRDT